MINKKPIKRKAGTANLFAGSERKLNALLEIGLEEVPSRFLPIMLADLKEKASKELGSSRLAFGSVAVYGTPRRLVLYIENLSAKQEDLKKEVRGPQRTVSYNSNGSPTGALLGFAKSQGVALQDLKIKKAGDKEYVFANVVEKGQKCGVILEQLFTRLIKSLYLPISMRWGCVDYRFVRPIHWITAICGKEFLDLNIAGIRSSSFTMGHRMLCGKPVKISIRNGIDINTFMADLRKGHVVLDQDERRAEIAKEIEAAAKKLGGKVLEDPELIEHVSFLVEKPASVTGSFNKEFLSLPRDVLITSMKKHQKYFAVTDQSGKLLPNFVNITNGTAPANLKNVAYGNEKVLTARLNDAKFFFEEDRQKFLADLTPKLANVAFYEKLGNMEQKVERITALSEWIAKELKLPDLKKENIKDISRLCKSDLLTQMVYEFPELQGVMGREYAKLEGKSDIVSEGIFEHYLPRFAGDVMPRSIEGAVIGIADKIDSITGCFSIGIIPTGSEDPFGLRRQALGVITVLIEKKLNLELDILIEKAYEIYSRRIKEWKVEFAPQEKVIPEVLQFLAARLKGVLMEKGISYDVADAVLAVFDDPLDSFDKALAIAGSAKEPWFPGIASTADRVKRLAVNATRGNVLESDLAAEAEKSLYQLALEVNGAVSEALSKDDYASALREYSKMTDPVEDFFNKVMVMDKDERLKTNRLALLRTIERMYLEFADFTKLVIKGS